VIAYGAGRDTGNNVKVLPYVKDSPPGMGAESFTIGKSFTLSITGPVSGIGYGLSSDAGEAYGAGVT
jgi:hypothetical protein